MSSAAATLPTDSRRDFLLTMAKAAIVNGRLSAASAAAAEALRGAPPNSLEEARARLYLSTARIFTDSYDVALAALQSIAGSKLDRSDAALLAAVRSAAAQLRMVPSAGAIQAQGASPEEAKANETALRIGQAEAALKRTANIAAESAGAPP